MVKMNQITIKIKLPDYCRTTDNPRLKIVEVHTPQKWLPTYEEIAKIINALSECEKINKSIKEENVRK